MEQEQSLKPFYQITERVFSGDTVEHLGVYTGVDQPMYLDDWAIFCDATATKLYGFMFGVSQSNNIYINWSGVCYYYGGLLQGMNGHPWGERFKCVITHYASTGSGESITAHYNKDGQYTADTRRLTYNTGLGNSSHWELTVGGTSDRTDRYFYGTIHDLTIYPNRS